MPSGRHETDAVEYYEPRHFSHSVTYRSWVKLFIADAYALESLDGFEGTGARFWLNHPIRWVQLVGTVVSVMIKPTFAEIEIDDGSGRCIPLNLRGQVADSIGVNFEKNRCDADVTSLVKAKGTLDVDHKGSLHLSVLKIQILTDPSLEFVAWQDRLVLRSEVLDIPWRLDLELVSERQITVAGEAGAAITGCRSRSSKREEANVKAQLKEQARSKEKFDICALDPRMHTQRNLKVYLLQYFSQTQVREFTVSQLRTVPEIERATVCVARQSRRSLHVAAGVRSEDAESLSVTSTQKYRTLNACLAELVRDGSILSTSTELGSFCIVGHWNLGVLISELAAVKFPGVGSLDEIPTREMWKEVRAAGRGFESISKQIVQKIMEELVMRPIGA